MIAIGFMMFVGLLVVVFAALAITRSVSLDYEKMSDRLHEPGAETLVYDVPNGQDPVDLTVALARAGFTSVEDNAKGMCQVLVECPHGRVEDRAKIRSVIGQAPAPGANSTTGIGAVVFADER